MMSCKRNLLLAITLYIPISDAQSPCHITLSRPIIDYGHITQKAVEEYKGGWYKLGENSVVVTSWCEKPQKMAIFFSGKAKGKEFQFGDDGRLLVSASQAMLDGHAVQLGKTTNITPFIVQLPGHPRLPVSNGDGLLPLKNDDIPSGQQYSLILELSPAIGSQQHKIKDTTDYVADMHIMVEAVN